MKKFRNYVLAGYPLLWVQTHEEDRAIATFYDQLENTQEKYKVYTYDSVDGIQAISVIDGEMSHTPIVMEKPAGDPASLFGGGAPATSPIPNPIEALSWFEKHAEGNSVIFLKDFHHYVAVPDVSRKIRNLISKFKACGKIMTIISPKVEIPAEIEKDITVIHFDLPNRDELKIVLKGLCESTKAKYPKNFEEILDASLGMTAFEAESAFSVSLIEKKKFDADMIRKEKSAIVKKTGILEVIEAEENLDTIGGLENLKEWLESRKGTFSAKARTEGIDPARGLLLVGVPGTGKSLTAKVVASVWKRPLLRLDLGRVKDKYVGESEGRIRSVLNIAETIAPDILFIDEMEKSVSNDGHEVSKSILSTILTWMEEHTADVFVMATANAAASLPEELVDRFEKVFWVDLPDYVQRKEIINIHLKKKGKKIEDFAKDMDKLSAVSKGFNGRGIRKWIAEALVYALNKNHTLCTADLLATVKGIKPFKDTEEMKKRRKWALEQEIDNASIIHAEPKAPKEEKKGARKVIMSS